MKFAQIWNMARGQKSPTPTTTTAGVGNSPSPASPEDREQVADYIRGLVGRHSTDFSPPQLVSDRLCAELCRKLSANQPPLFSPDELARLRTVDEEWSLAFNALSLYGRDAASARFQSQGAAVAESAIGGGRMERQYTKEELLADYSQRRAALKKAAGNRTAEAVESFKKATDILVPLFLDEAERLAIQDLAIDKAHELPFTISAVTMVYLSVAHRLSRDSEHFVERYRDPNARGFGDRPARMLALVGIDIAGKIDIPRAESHEERLAKRQAEKLAQAEADQAKRAADEKATADAERAKVLEAKAAARAARDAENPQSALPTKP